MSRSLDALHGLRLESASHDADTQQWVFVFSRSFCLRASCPWRLVAGTEITLGWKDDGRAFGLPVPLDATLRLRESLADRPVRSATLSPVGDLHVAFGDGRELQFFHDSCGQEGWQLDGPSGESVIAQGGGRVVEWRPDA